MNTEFPGELETPAFSLSGGGTFPIYTKMTGNNHTYCADVAISTGYFAIPEHHDSEATDYLSFSVLINAHDEADNTLNYEQNINGVFGGVLDFMEYVWDTIVGTLRAAWDAVKEAVDWLVEWIKGMISKIFDEIIMPLKESIHQWILGIEAALSPLTDSSVNSKFKSTLSFLQLEDDNSISSEKMAQNLWQAMMSGGFFYLLLTLAGAIMTIQALTSTFSATLVPVNNIMISFTKDEIIKIIIKYAATIAISATITSSVEAILYHIVPEDDPFWYEGIGLSIFGICTSLGIILTGAHYAGLIGLKLFGDAIGLLVSIMGLVISILLSDPILAGFIGLVLSGIGLILTSKNDVMDLLGGPLSPIEEIIAGVSFSYSFTSLLHSFNKK